MCLAATGMVADVASAQDVYPTKPVEMVVPWPPGGGTDSVGRAIAEAARAFLPQPMVVVNRPGASGTIGYSYVTTGAPDGYRVCLITPEVLLAPLMGIGKVTIDDFQPVVRLTDDPLAVTVKADAPWKSIEEFLAYGKANPGKLSIAIAGNGTTHHVGAAALAHATGVRFNIVPYQGSAPAILGLLSGNVDATTAAFAELSQHVQAGKLRTLAVMAEKRVEGLAAVPTMKERGHNLQYSTWRGIGLPKDTPKDIVDQWRSVGRNVAQAAAFKETMSRLSLTSDFADAPEFSGALGRQAQDDKKLLALLK